MAEAAAIHIEGTMTVEAKAQTMGLENARPLTVLQDVQPAPYIVQPLSSSLLADYSLTLGEAIRGWYPNPLCAPHCETLPVLHISPNGRLHFTNGTRAMWNGELLVEGELAVVEGSHVSNQGVGFASSSAKVEVTPAAALDLLSDMTFDRDATVFGQGHVVVSGIVTGKCRAHRVCADRRCSSHRAWVASNARVHGLHIGCQRWRSAVHTTVTQSA